MIMQPITPVDPLFPKLAPALDSDRAAAAFATALADNGYPTQSLSCEIERSRLKAGRKVLIGYRLRGRDVAGRFFDQRVMVALFPGGDALALTDVSNGARLTKPSFGPPTLRLKQLGGQAWFFPNDRKVHHIVDLLSSEHGKAEVVHYVPEQGCTVRVARVGSAALYGKCRADDRGAVAARVHASAKGLAKAIRLAPVTQYDQERRLLWQEGVPGLAVDPTDILARPHHWSARITNGLRDLHSLPAPDGLSQLTIASLSANAALRAVRTASAMPQLAQRIHAVQAAIDASRPAETELVLSHCDLHPGNLLWDGERFAVIDLDTAALAPPALDYGTLTAALIHKAIEANARDTVIRTMVSALRNAAVREIGDEASFDWFTAASLIGERLYRCSTRLKSPRLAVRERLVALAENLVLHHA
jgi:aminoglycoside phosphotransferase